MTGAIAIVGMGCRYPDADGPDRLWETVLAGRRAFRGIPRTRLNPDDYLGEAGDPDRTYAGTAAVLDGWEFDRARFRVPGPAHRVTDPAHWLALEIASEALADAGFPGGEGLDRDRVAVVLGNTMAGEVSRAAQLRLRWPYVRRTVAAALAGEGLDDAAQARLLARLEHTYKAPFPEPNDESLAGGLANTIAGRICNHFDLRGGGHTVDGACASSLLSVIAGCSALLSGDADLVIAGGVDLSLDPFELVGFARTGALATDAMRVYDAAPTGFWPGEGCGMVALMRSEDAAAAGRVPLATIQGWGTSSDGQGGITRPEAGGQLLALRRAYRRAGFGPHTVELFEGHGTGTAVGDRAELEALIAAHEGMARGGRPAALGTVKANIGHTKAAAGVAGLIKAVQALRHRVLPPTTGCDTPHPLLEDAPLRVVGEAEAWPDGPSPARAAVSAMGFGGINTHVVLEAAQHLPGQVTLRGPLDEQVFVMAAWSREELQVLLDRIAVRAETMSHAELLDLAATLPTEGEFRVGIVASDPGRLARRARLAARLEPGGELAAGPGIYAGRGARVPVGLLFTGQGSAVDGGTDTAVAQPAIVAAELAGLRRLERLGVRAAGAVGHSLGEISALHWAGALTDDDAMMLAERRGQIMAAQGRADTGMASVAADPGTVAGLLRGTGLVVAADNGVAQVIAGDLDELEAALARARDAGLTARRLEVGHAYHSPAMAAVAEPLAAFLAGMLISVPGRPVHSTITGARLSADEDLRGLLVRQVTAPVRFGEAVSGLAHECGLLVEVGPAGGLAGLAEAATGVPAVTLNAGGVAALFAAGAIRDAAPLFAGRFHRPFDLWRDPVFLESPCESAPEVQIPQQRTVRVPMPQRVEQLTERGGGSVAQTVRRLVAEALELPLDAVGDGDRLLADLHLNSLRVAQLAGRAATDCGRAAPAAPPALADATVGAIIEMIEALPRAGSADPAAPVAGVGEWHRILVPEPVAPEPVPELEDGAVRVALPEAPGDDDIARLVAAAREAIARAVPLEIVDPGNVASGFIGTLRAEHPELSVRHVPGNALRHRPLITPAPTPASASASAGVDFPFGPQDVALITGGAKGIGLESARALARHGVRLVLMGRSAELEPGAAAHELGADVRYVSADVTDADAVAKALAPVGPVSLLIHAAGINRPARFADLDAADFADHAAPKVRGLANVLDALDTSALRALVSYGSVIGRFGLPGEAHYALANGRMRELVRRTAARLPGCWVCNVEWTVWSGAGMGDRLDVLDGLGRAGVVPLPAERGAELLLRLLSTRPAVPSVLVTGRLPALEAAGSHRTHTPGVEVITERELTAAAPLLADHRIGGVTVVPAVVMLEAMVSAVRELTGRPPSGLANLRWDRPITIPDDGARTLRICALRREDGTVDIVVRTDETGFEVDHAAGRTVEGPLASPGVAAPETAPPAHEGTDLYGSLFFHGPAYQRLIRYERLESKGCVAILRGGDGLAIDDASIHVLQGCVPHRRLLPVGCEEFARHPYEGPGGELRVTAVERDHQGADYTYDVVVTASDGRPVLSWRGLRLRDVGPIEHPGGLPAVLAGPYLERNAGALLGEGWRVRVESELCLPEEPSPWPGVAGEIVRLTGEPEEHAFTRVRTIEECLSQQGLDAASVPLTVEGVYEDGWVLMRVGNGTAASCVLRLAGRTDPVAVAVLAEGEGEGAGEEEGADR